MSLARGWVKIEAGGYAGIPRHTVYWQLELGGGHRLTVARGDGGGWEWRHFCNNRGDGLVAQAQEAASNSTSSRIEAERYMTAWASE